MINPITSALTNIRRTPYQSVIAFGQVTITCFIAVLFAHFAFGSHQLITYFETSPQVIAFFELDSTEAEQQEVRDQFQSRSDIAELTLVTQQDALEIYRQENDLDPLLLELVTADILPASLEISGTNLEVLPGIRADLEQFASIDSVELQEDLVDELRSWTNTIRMVGATAAGILGLLSLVTITTLISLKVMTRRGTIAIMRLLGASSWFVTGPFVWEGMLYALVSYSLGWAAAAGIVLGFTPNIETFVEPAPVLPFPMWYWGATYGAGLLIAAVLGAWASQVAVRRVMK